MLYIYICYIGDVWTSRPEQVLTLSLMKNHREVTAIIIAIAITNDSYYYSNSYY